MSLSTARERDNVWEFCVGPWWDTDPAPLLQGISHGPVYAKMVSGMEWEGPDKTQCPGCKKPQWFRQGRGYKFCGSCSWMIV